MTTASEFAFEARLQQHCACCGKRGAHEAHHVVAKQVLKRSGLGALLWCPDNALRLCSGIKSCHAQMEARMLVVPTDKLTDRNICFVWQALGVAGHNYLERRYTGPDRRFSRHQEGACPLCQP